MKDLRNLCMAAVVLTLAACDRKPLERAGKAVDRSWEKIGEKLKEVWRY